MDLDVREDTEEEDDLSGCSSSYERMTLSDYNF